MISHSKPMLDSSDFEAVRKVMETGMIEEGEMVTRFENEISKYLGLEGGVVTYSGAAAIYLALETLDIKKNDEVILPSYVCRSVMDAVIWAGGTPVLCDIGADWNVNIDTIKPHLSKKTKAIIVVHTFGIAADVSPMCDLDIPIIEDICQAFGAKRNGQYVGTFGDFAICSFGATKLITTGGGGMLLSKDGDMLDKIRYIKYNQMSFQKERHMFRLNDIQATLGISQLSKYDWILDRRRDIADQYFSAFEDLLIELPHSIRHKSIFFRFPILLDRDFGELQKEFATFGIAVRRGVDDILHRHTNLNPKEFQNTEKLFNSTLSIPIYPALKQDEIKHIIDTSLHIFKHD